MNSTQTVFNSSDSYHLVKSMIDGLSWSERERLKYEINLEHASNHNIDEPKKANLTDRECQVLTLIANGYTRKEVGGALKISHNTASCHVSHIYEKLEISTIAEATHAAMRLGIL